MKKSVMEVTLLDHMGDDLTVVNAARVSFGKRKETENFKEITIKNKKTNVSIIDESDEKLINYLAKHDHWSPFAHVSLQFYIKAPIFVARQLAKHQVGLVWNEISRRYVDSDPEFYIPDYFRIRSKNKKQGSLDIEKEDSIYEHTNNCLQEYKRLLNNEIAPELARMVLPLNTMTEWYFSGSLYAFKRICQLRMSEDAQKETKEIASMINNYCKEVCPVSWTALMS